MKVRSRTGASRCLPCGRRHNAEYYRTSPARRERQRRGHFSRRYGVTLEALERLLHEQDGRCAICRKPWQSCRPAKRARDENLFLHHLCVDHDHESGRVRGLLCNACNTGIGVFEDDPARFLNAIAYLQSSQEARG